MIISLTEKEIAEVKYAIEMIIEKYEDKAQTEENDKNYEAAERWYIKAYNNKKILEKI